MSQKISTGKTEAGIGCKVGRRCHRSNMSFISSIKAIHSGNVFPLIPLTAGSVPLIFMGASFGVGISGDHNISKTPYPSDLGINQPERGLFTLSLSLTAATCVPCVIFRYIQIINIGYDEYKMGNLFSAVCGLVHIFGGCVVYSYSEKESVFGHYIGALLYFLFGVLYISMQSEFSRRLIEYHPRPLAYFRFFMAMVGFVTMFVFFPSRIFTPKEKSRYYIPQTCEWIMGGIFTIFFLTFVYDFNGLWCNAENTFDKIAANNCNQKMILFVDNSPKEVDKRQGQTKESHQKSSSTVLVQSKDDTPVVSFKDDDC